MNKKIEDAAIKNLGKEFLESTQHGLSLIRAFKAGAEWALREAIEHFKNNFNSVQLLNKHGINKELEQFLSTKGEKNGTK